MLGRRKFTGAPGTPDIAERIKRRALGARKPVEELATPAIPANDSLRFPIRRTGVDCPEGRGGEPAEVLSFDATPTYRIQAAQPVAADLVAEALELMRDRMDLADLPPRERESLRPEVAEAIGEVLADLDRKLDATERPVLVERLLDDLCGHGPLDLLLADPSVDRILVNGPGPVQVERRGRRQSTDLAFRSDAHLMRVARRMAWRACERLDREAPVADLRLAGGSRALVVIPPIAVGGVSITIDKYRPRGLTLEWMVRQGNLSAEMAQLLELAVACRLNILVTGPRGAGKTTLLDALCRAAGPDERIVTIEDRAELKLDQPNVLRLETRGFAPGRHCEVTARDLTRSALLMRPDRLVLGELRADEAAGLIFAQAAGCEGVMTTLNAPHTRGAIERLETLMALSAAAAAPAAARAQIAAGLDLIVHLEKGRDGRRRVTRIAEVAGAEEHAVFVRDLYGFEDRGDDASGRVAGTFDSSGWTPRFVERAAELGLEVPAGLAGKREPAETGRIGTW